MANSHMTFGVDLLPKTTNTYNLGNSSQKWNIFVNTINGVEPSFTDTKVNYSLAQTTKAYLMASSNAPTSTATGREAVGDTGVYLTATAGEVSALRMSLHDTSATPVEKAYAVWNATDSSIDFVFV